MLVQWLGFVAIQHSRNLRVCLFTPWAGDWRHVESFFVFLYGAYKVLAPTGLISLPQKYPFTLPSWILNYAFILRHNVLRKITIIFVLVVCFLFIKDFVLRVVLGALQNLWEGVETSRTPPTSTHAQPPSWSASLARVVHGLELWACTDTLPPPQIHRLHWILFWYCTFYGFPSSQHLEYRSIQSVAEYSSIQSISTAFKILCALPSHPSFSPNFWHLLVFFAVSTVLSSSEGQIDRIVKYVTLSDWLVFT